jgi:hypothetical protein
LYWATRRPEEDAYIATTGANKIVGAVVLKRQAKKEWDVTLCESTSLEAGILLTRHLEGMAQAAGCTVLSSTLERDVRNEDDVLERILIECDFDGPFGNPGEFTMVVDDEFQKVISNEEAVPAEVSQTDNPT